MSSLAELPELVGFFSYSRKDDEHSGGGLYSKATHPVRWAVSLIRKRAEELGTIEPPDEQTAIAKAAFTRDR